MPYLAALLGPLVLDDWLLRDMLLPVNLPENIDDAARVWRYLDQCKAQHLLTSVPTQLYLRRLDLLASCCEGDPYEGTPTFDIFQGWKQAHVKVFGHANEAELLRHFERERKATFVSCWRMSEHESWLMWKQYCKKGGGLALQTTMKQLRLLHAAFCERNPPLFLKPVCYLNHWTNQNVQHTVPIQVFLKPLWFSDEREIRFALWRHDCAWGGTEEQIEHAFARVKEYELIPINLDDFVERIVLSPFSTDDQRKEIVDLIVSRHSKLMAKLHDSAITKKTVLSGFAKSPGPP